ncbi:MAG TPA: YkvA family protein, partial [Devosia sp.]
MAGWVDRAKQWARSIKRDVLVVWLIAKDRRTPWSVRILAGCVAAYALSPIDLIPDFIPVLGYLDDLLIVPLGIVAVIKLMPASVLAEHRKA